MDHKATSIPPELIGTWRQTSGVHENLDTGEKTHTFGLQPIGFVQFTADGRMTALTVHCERRRPAAIVPDREETHALYHSMLAYGGTFTVAGNTVTYHLDVSWNQAWTGTDQLRYWRIEGNRLFVQTPEFEDPFIGERTVHRVSFEKMTPADNRLALKP